MQYSLGCHGVVPDSLGLLHGCFQGLLKLAPLVSINAVRAEKKGSVPMVMTREEIACFQLWIKLFNGSSTSLYGRRLRIMEAVRLRVKNIDCQTDEAID